MQCILRAHGDRHSVGSRCAACDRQRVGAHDDDRACGKADGGVLGAMVPCTEDCTRVHCHQDDHDPKAWRGHLPWTTASGTDGARSSDGSSAARRADRRTLTRCRSTVVPIPLVLTRTVYDARRAVQLPPSRTHAAHHVPCQRRHGLYHPTGCIQYTTPRPARASLSLPAGRSAARHAADDEPSAVVVQPSLKGRPVVVSLHGRSLPFVGDGRLGRRLRCTHERDACCPGCESSAPDGRRDDQ